MNILPEADVKDFKQSLAVWGAGSWPSREIGREIAFLSGTGGLEHLLCSAALVKDPAEVKALDEEIHRHCADAVRDKGAQGSGRYAHYGQRLGGPGKEFLKSVPQGIRLLPYYARDVESTAHWFASHLVAGVEVLLQHLSSGGTIVAQAYFERRLAESIARPPLVISSTLRPGRLDAAAHLIFVEQIRMLLANDLGGADLLVIRDNEAATLDRPLELLDRLAVAAQMGPFSAKRGRTWAPPAEVYGGLARTGRLAGIWGKRVSFSVYRSGPFPWSARVKSRSEVIDQTLLAAHSLLEDPRTSLTGVPAAGRGDSVFGIAGNFTQDTFAVVEDELVRYGRCLFVPAPFDHIYVTRLANIDEGNLAQDLGIGTAPQAQAFDADGHRLEPALQAIGRRLGLSEDPVLRPWARRTP